MARSNDLRKIEAVFFDAGFTLIEPLNPVEETYYRLAREVGAEVDRRQLESRISHFRASGGAIQRMVDSLETSDDKELEIWHRFTRVIAEPFPSLVDRHHSWFEALIEYFDDAAAWKLMDGARTAVESVRSLVDCVGIVSNWSSRLKTIVQSLEFADCLDFVLTSGEAGYRKPHAGIFEQALRYCRRVDRTSVVHVGDNWDEDVVGARQSRFVPVFLSENAKAEDVLTYRSASAFAEHLAHEKRGVRDAPV